MSVRSLTEMLPNQKYMSGLINYFAGINLSIRSKILLSFFVIILSFDKIQYVTSIL